VAAAAVFGLGIAPAFAQPVPPGANPETGARPGNVIGTGNSLPMSSHAANINGANTRSLIAPRLPEPPVAEGSSPRQFLMAARQALVSGQTGVAQEALERAEARQLDRSVEPSRAGDAIGGPVVTEIGNARQALGNGDRDGAIRIIDALLQRLPGG
ncbi:MAG: hypothetical protein JO047_08885, partial [Alphaproteobacteria bacterium]|nr:hypothetical protein [Alphaproteobacteria bacterium]